MPINASTPWTAKRTGYGRTEYTKTDGKHELVVFRNIQGFTGYATGWTFRTNGWAEDDGFIWWETAKALMAAVDADIHHWEVFDDEVLSSG